ncbi:MAG: DUF4116 domain-containing protein [Parachlamydiaceae bacterium]|nr:DUF4116 domain-containing protein [Parachlamydiaceae bacterium]
MLSKIDNICFKIMKYCDFIPVVITLSNYLILFKKCVLDNVIGAINVKSRSFTYLKEKPILLCIVLLFPIFGNIVFFIYVHNKFQKEKEIVLAAVKEDGMVLEHADIELKKNKEVVLAAVKEMV